MPLAFFVLAQYRRVTDRQTDGRTDGHVAIAITRANIASRGKKQDSTQQSRWPVSSTAATTATEQRLETSGIICTCISSCGRWRKLLWHWADRHADGDQRLLAPTNVWQQNKKEAAVQVLSLAAASVYYVAPCRIWAI